jgi:hypothetical protein
VLSVAAARRVDGGAQGARAAAALRQQAECADMRGQLGNAQVDHSSQAGPVLPGHDVGDISDLAVELFAGTKMPLGKVPSPLCF